MLFLQAGNCKPEEFTQFQKADKKAGLDDVSITGPACNDSF